MMRTHLGNCVRSVAMAWTIAFGVATAASCQEFVFSNDKGSILRLDRAADLSVKGTICAPTAGPAACKLYDVQGVNTPGTLSLAIEGTDAPAKTINYYRVPKGSPDGATGYTVWRSTSADAPDYLKSFRAPINKTDPVSDRYLQRWGGDNSKLLGLEIFARAENSADAYFAKRGFPVRSKRTVPLIVARPQAASWEALVLRGTGERPDITTFSTGMDGAVVAAETSVVLASLENQDTLSPYIANTAVARPSLLRLRAPVESIFDKYIDPSKRSGALTELNRILVAGFPTETCQADLFSESEFNVGCETHTSKYNSRMEKYFVSSLFVFLIGAPEENSRSIYIVQETIGAQGPMDRDRPSPLNFKISPESNSNISYVGNELKKKLSRTLMINFPTIRLDQ